MFYAHLFKQYRAFASFFDSHLILKSVSDVMSNSSWQVAMEDEMHAFDQNEIWKLVPLPAVKKALGYQWVYTVKLKLI